MQVAASISYLPSPAEIACTGHSASQAPQLMHSVLILYAMKTASFMIVFQMNKLIVAFLPPDFKPLPEKSRQDASHPEPLPRQKASRVELLPTSTRELFSLRKKRAAGIRPSAWQTLRSLYRLNPPLFPLLKKMGIQGGPGPLGRSSRAAPLEVLTFGCAHS